MRARVTPDGVSGKMHPLAQSFRTQIPRPDRPDEPVVVACSGGLDSLVLLHLFCFAGPTRRPLTVAHFDHRMRPDSSSDLEWLRGLCVAWGVRFQGAQADAPLTSEAAARAARYSFLETTAEATGAAFIATAHHADDQAETVLFRMLRGTGPDGLAGIPAQRGRIIRPLLGSPRALLLEYAQAHALTWREDASNQSRRYARNRIRLDVLPALEAQRPGTRAALLRVARDARRLRQAWELLLEQIEGTVMTAQSTELIELARPLLLKYHPELRVRLLRRWLARLGSPPGRAGTATLAAFITAGASGSSIHLQGGLRVTREFDTLRLSRAAADATGDRPLVIENAGVGTGETTVGGTRYQVRWSHGGHAAGVTDAVALDPDSVRFPLAVRGWLPGDRIRLAAGSKKLKKLFVEQRIGRQSRSTVPVLVDTDGNVLWVAGLAQSEAARPRPNQSAFCITVRNGQPD